ncbi:hypothetical protein IWW51_004593, partial [Coemansia sp. RSA 2702]
PELQLAEVLATSVVNVRPTMPTPLCRSTCESWLDSLHTIVNNSTLCQPDKGNNREASFDSLRKKCDLNMYSGAPDHCVAGETNELKTCGYQRVEDWCKYCDSAPDYADVCASVGVDVGDSSSRDKSKSGTPPNTSDHNPVNNELMAELDRQKRQERVFRVVAIVLSIAVGVCVIALIALISMGHRLTSFGAYAHHLNASNSGSSKDDSTLLHLGADAQPKKSTDFVDCFVAAVGKPRQVVRPFFARRDDEISLQNGDVVTLQMAFDDGWVVGKNLTSGNEGTFPLMCVMENLPPSLPAQWSVLPESKNASIENMRNSSRASVARGHRASGDTGGRSEAASIRMQSTRASFTANRQPSNSADGSDPNKGKGILSRLMGAFSPTNATGVSAAAADSEESGFFKRLVTSPFGGKDKRNPDEAKGRPHSFNVHHVVHVGLASPNYPHSGNVAMSPSTIPSTMRSENRYPVMPAPASLRYNDVAHQNASHVPSAPDNPRHQNMGYGEFAPSNNSQPTTTGDNSMETYRTAEQSAYNGSGVALAGMPAYLRQ